MTMKCKWKEIRLLYVTREGEPIETGVLIKIIRVVKSGI